MKVKTAISIILLCLPALLVACTAREDNPVPTPQETKPTSTARIELVPTQTKAATSTAPVDPGNGGNQESGTPPAAAIPSLVSGPPPVEGVALMGLVAENSQQSFDQTEPHEIAVEARLQQGDPLVFPPWCGKDEETVKANVRHLDYLVDFDGETHNLSEELGWHYTAAETMYCAFLDAYLLFPGPGEHLVRFTVRIESVINDGTDLYQPGDRVYRLNLDVK